MLVTGAAGFIGSQAAARLARDGWRVIGCDSFDPSCPRALQRDRVAHHEVRLQAELVDVVQAFANPERGDRAAVQVHGLVLWAVRSADQKTWEKRSGR